MDQSINDNLRQDKESKDTSLLLSHKSMRSIAFGFALLYGAYISDWLSYRLSSFRLYRPSAYVYDYIKDIVPEFSNVAFTFTDTIGHFVVAGVIGYIVARYLALPLLNITKWSNYGIALVVCLILVFNALTVYRHFSGWIFSSECYGFSCGGWMFPDYIFIIKDFVLYFLYLIVFKKILLWREKNKNKLSNRWIWGIVIICTILLLLPRFFWSDLLWEINNLLI